MQTLKQKRLCAKCLQYVCQPCNPAPLPANDNERTGVVWVLPDLLLRQKSRIKKNARYMVMQGVTSRRAATWIATQIFEFLRKGGLILNIDGTAYDVGDTAIDDATGRKSAGRWYRVLLAYGRSRTVKLRAQNRTLMRYRLIAIAVAIHALEQDQMRALAARMPCI